MELQPSCSTAIITLSTAVGILITGITVGAICSFKDRICCTPGDSRRVYDTPCPYCQIKQPRDCMREHLAECGEHRKYWSPRLSRRELLLPPFISRPSRVVVRLQAPVRPVSLDAVLKDALNEVPPNPSTQ